MVISAVLNSCPMQGRMLTDEQAGAVVKTLADMTGILFIFQPHPGGKTVVLVRPDNLHVLDSIIGKVKSQESAA